MDRQPSSRERTLRLQERVFAFVCGLLRACPKTHLDLASDAVWRQLVRAAVSTANNLEEADGASSRADFRARMRITLREAKEARLCIRTLIEAQLAAHEAAAAFADEARQLVAIFTAIVKTASRKEPEP